MIVRPATAHDVPAVVALEVELFGPDAWSAASVAEELTGGRRTAVVAVDPEVVGYAVTLASDVVDLQRIGVAATYRRRGLAHRLLAAVATGDRMLLEVSARNTGAIAFYETEGFTEIGRRRRYYRDGADAVVMERATQ